MPEKQMNWCRLYNETVGDRKLARAARITGQPRVVVLGLWSGIMCLASESSDRGALMLSESVPLQVEDIADIVGAEVDATRALLDAFVSLDMLALEGDAYVIAHWAKRQFESDNSKGRVQALRERRRNVDVATPDAPCNGDVTLHDRYTDVTVTVPEQNRAEQIQSKTEPAAPLVVVGSDERQIGTAYTQWEQLSGRLLTAMDCDQIGDLITTYGPANVSYAMQEASNRGKRTLAYVIGILRNLQGQARAAPTPTLPKDLLTDEDLEAAGYIPPSKAKAISDAAWRKKYGSTNSICPDGPVTV